MALPLGGVGASTLTVFLAFFISRQSNLLSVSFGKHDVQSKVAVEHRGNRHSSALEHHYVS